MEYILIFWRISVQPEYYKTSFVPQMEVQVCEGATPWTCIILIILIQQGYSSHPLFFHEISSALLKHTKKRPELFIPLCAIIRYSQTPGLFTEPLIPFSHSTQIKITYLILTDICSGAPLLCTQIIETINPRCSVHLH